MRRRWIVLAVVAGLLGGVATAALLLPASKRTRATRVFCDNSLCLRLPSGWTVRTDYGGIAIRIIAAPFRLPGWVGNNREGVIEIPRGQFVLMVEHSDRGYTFGFPRVRTLSISKQRVRLEPSWTQGSRSIVTRNVTFLHRSVNLGVYFADARPSSKQVARVNEILATAHLAPPPAVTQ